MKKREISGVKNSPKCLPKPLRPSSLARETRKSRAPWGFDVKRNKQSRDHWVSMPYEHQKQLWEICEATWRHVSKRLILLRLTTQEIEDLKSAAMLRPFQKFGLFKPEKAPLEIWTKTVMRRALINGLRAILPDGKIEEHKTRISLLRPEPIGQRVVEIGAHREHSIFTENDVAADHSADNLPEILESPKMMSEFISLLSPKHQRFINRILSGESVKNATDGMGIPLMTGYGICRYTAKKYRWWSARDERAAISSII